MNLAADLGGNCACLCTNYKYGRSKTLFHRLDIDHLSSEVGLGPHPVCLLSVMP